MAKGKREKDWVQRPNYHRQASQRQEDRAMRKNPWSTGNWDAPIEMEVDPALRMDWHRDPFTGGLAYTTFDDMVRQQESQRRQLVIDWAMWLNAHLEGNEIPHVIATALRVRRMVLIHGVGSIDEVVGAVRQVINVIRRHEHELHEILNGEERMALSRGQSIIQVLRLNFVISDELSRRLCNERFGLRVSVPSHESPHTGWEPDAVPTADTIMGIPIVTLGTGDFTNLLRHSDEYR